jgi:hypothetical protein
MMLEEGVAPSWQPETPWRNPLSSAEASAASLHAAATSSAQGAAGKPGAGAQLTATEAGMLRMSRSPGWQLQLPRQHWEQAQQQQLALNEVPQGMDGTVDGWSVQYDGGNRQGAAKRHTSAAAAVSSTSWDAAPGRGFSSPGQVQYPQVGHTAAAAAAGECHPPAILAAATAGVKSMQPLKQAGQRAAARTHQAAAMSDQSTRWDMPEHGQVGSSLSPTRHTKVLSGTGKRSRVRGMGHSNT